MARRSRRDMPAVELAPMRARAVDHINHGALFIIDGLGPDARERTDAAAAALIDGLAAESSAASFTVRAVSA